MTLDFPPDYAILDAFENTRPILEILDRPFIHGQFYAGADTLAVDIVAALTFT